MMSERGIVPIIEWILYNQEAVASLCLSIVFMFMLVVGIRERNRQVSIRDLDKRIAKLEKAVDILVQMNRRDRPQQ